LKSQSFSAEYLISILNALQVKGPFYIAYSGGMDSSVLLHAMSRAKALTGIDIHALHVNHGLSENADKWSKHCELTCKKLSIDFKHLKISEKWVSGESRESWARNLRYQLLIEAINGLGVLMTAHHREDQAETLLLQLFRGAGVRGLSGMPRVFKRKDTWHVRPMLDITPQLIEEYARENELEWVEDESNLDVSYDRNFLRKNIVPQLRQRWPGISNTLARVSAHQAEAGMLLDEVASKDLNLCLGDYEDTLSLVQLLGLSSARQANLIRYWLRQIKFAVPSTAKIEEILENLLPVRKDANPVVSWMGCDMRRYNKQLYACEPLADHDPASELTWNMNSICEISDGQLNAELVTSVGIKTDLCPDGLVQIRYRQGGEKIQLISSDRRKDLKNIFQEKAIPPWLRDRIPLLYVGGTLIAVADLFIDAKARTENADGCWKITWTGRDKFLPGSDN
jgi:tRNA(Ile)-lysidine synthase